jgi:hypothetical protein
MYSFLFLCLYHSLADISQLINNVLYKCTLLFGYLKLPLRYKKAIPLGRTVKMDGKVVMCASSGHFDVFLPKMPRLLL